MSVLADGNTQNREEFVINYPLYIVVNCDSLKSDINFNFRTQPTCYLNHNCGTNKENLKQPIIMLNLFNNLSY